MAIRKIVKIDEQKCNGCGLCIPNCAEGALQIVDGKARLVTDSFCDGLGACLGTCPQDAITIEEREAEAFDEEAVEAHVATQASAADRAPADAPTHTPPAGGCPGARMMTFDGLPPKAAPKPHGGGHGGGCPGAAMRAFEKAAPAEDAGGGARSGGDSELGHWPVQLALLPTRGPMFQDTELALAADCAAFALGDFHERILKGRALAIACPKLDDTGPYVEKLAEILRSNPVRGLVLVHMEVPCCTGIVAIAREAARLSGRTIPARDVVVSVRGEILKDELTVLGG